MSESLLILQRLLKQGILLNVFFWKTKHALFHFFFTIYLNISHIQNRYNLIFFCLSEKQGFFGTMGEDENETGKEQMLNLKKRTMLGK